MNKIFFTLITIGTTLTLSGCAFGGLLPLTLASMTGQDRVTLGDQAEYANIIDSKIILRDTDDYRWTLRKHTKGRYFVQKKYPGLGSTDEVCSLNNQEILVTDIFEDRINGGIFYSAVVTCDGINEITTTRNFWYGDF